MIHSKIVRPRLGYAGDRQPAQPQRRALLLLGVGLALALSSCQDARPDALDEALACGCERPALGKVAQGVGVLEIRAGQARIRTSAAASDFPLSASAGATMVYQVCNRLPAVDSLGAEQAGVPITFTGAIHPLCPTQGEPGTPPTYSLQLARLRVASGPTAPLPAPIPATVSWAPPCRDASLVPHQVFPELVCPDLALPLGEQQNQVIRSPQALAQAYGPAAARCGLPLPVIDFEQYTLLSGQIHTPQGSVVRAQRVVACPDGRYVYSVELGTGLTNALDHTLYAVVVPKLAGSQPVVFDVRRTL